MKQTRIGREEEREGEMEEIYKERRAEVLLAKESFVGIAP